MTGFVLKIRTKNGQEVLKTLEPYSTIGMLKHELSKITKIPIARLNVLSGFPLKHLNLAGNHETLESNHICSGDTLVVQEKYTTLQDEEGFITEYSYQSLETSGVLLKKTVPADNSCLFTSVEFALSGEVNPGSAVSMRNIIAKTVASDPETYNEAILGQPNADYCEWILQPTSWGGAIELAIMSKFYGIEIVVVDSVNGILNQFGEDQSYDYRIFLFFDGLHYDPLYLENFQDNTSTRPKTKFCTEDEKILQEAETLAKEAKASRQFTNVNKFTLQCLDCSIFLTGQKEAARHAKETRHTNFSEINDD